MEEVVEYKYDTWGRVIGMEGSDYGKWVGSLNPFRYRGYYYDDETGMYYLQSRYYNPEWGRFINLDGYVSTGQGQGLRCTNMFMYCSNNPVMFRDPEGESAEAILQSLYSALAGLALADGPLPFGDAVAIIVALVVTIVATVSAYNAAKSVSKSEARDKAKEKDLAPTKRKTITYFPVNPYDFKPKGLVRTTYVEPGSGTNGGIIKWEIPGTTKAIFEWDEDYIHGPHYHAMLVEWDNQHNRIHYPICSPVPEPWNTTYFGG